MPQIWTDTYFRMSHIAGPGCVLVSLRFGKTPAKGPLVTIRAAREGTIGPMKDIDRYVEEAIEGIAEANQIHGTTVELEEIEIVPDDCPTEGQVRHCAKILTAHFTTQTKQTDAGNRRSASA